MASGAGATSLLDEPCKCARNTAIAAEIRMNAIRTINPSASSFLD
jgi:hypothetical protein